MNNDRKRQLNYSDRPALKPFSAARSIGLPLVSTSATAAAADLVLCQPSGSITPIAASYRPSLRPSERPYLVHWLQSGSNLDFMVLALCSCVLTVLCHQPTLLPNDTASIATPPPPAAIDFALKAALLTKFPHPATPRLRSGDPVGAD